MSVAFGDARLKPRTWRRIAIATNGCWLWIGFVDRDGYGQRNGTMAHRQIYAALVGSVAKDRQIDHLCRVRRCVNPSHLEVVTKRENGRRGLRGMLTTHCPKGHAYDRANTYIRVDRPGRRRDCRACNRECKARKA